MAGNKSLTDLAFLKQPDPLLSFKWVALNLPNISGMQLPVSYLEAVDIPFNNIQVSEGVYAGSSFTYYPGSHDISAFNATFYEDSRATSMKWIQAWKSLMKDFTTGVYNLPSKYKQNMVIAMLDTQNSPVMTVRLKGVWPTETSNFSLNYNDSGRITISQTFSIDDQEISWS